MKYFPFRKSRGGGCQWTGGEEADCQWMRGLWKETRCVCARAYSRESLGVNKNFLNEMRFFCGCKTKYYDWKAIVGLWAVKSRFV